MIELKKHQAKTEQYSRRNNVEISRIPDSVLNQDLKKL